MRQYFQKHKWHLVIFVILLFTAGVSWHFSSIKTSASSADKLKLENIKTTTSTIFAVTPPITISKTQDTNKTQTPNSNNQTPNEQTNNNLTVYQFNSSTISLKVTSTSTVIDAMENSQLDFKTKTFSSLGEFVEEIGGLKNDNQNGKYWIYYINGATANLGISTQIVKPGDLIEWKYGNTNL